MNYISLETARPGDLLVTTDIQLGAAFDHAVLLIVKDDGFVYKGVFVHQPLCSAQEKYEALNAMCGQEIIDGAEELKGPILNGSAQNLLDFSHPGWGYNVRITAIHSGAKIRSPDTQHFGDFAVSQDERCKDLRGHGNKVLVLGEMRFDRFTLSQQFESGIWAGLVRGTREIVIETPAEQRWQMAHNAL